MKKLFASLIAFLFVATSALAQTPTGTLPPTPIPVPPTPRPSATPTLTATPTPAPTPIVIASTMLMPQNPTIPHGSTMQMTATLIYSDGSMQPLTHVAWSSSAPNIATISDTGLVFGVVPGKVTITGSQNGHTESTTVTVQ